jgi:SAM-dependent methyltransferase
MEGEVKFEQTEKEEQPKRVIVEIGPGNFSLLEKFAIRGDFEYGWGPGNEILFNLKEGDLFIEIDLPAEKSPDVQHAWRSSRKRKSGDESHLGHIKRLFDSHLPEGVKGEVLHATATKLPLEDGKIDVVYMANVVGGNVKNDFSGGENVKKAKILREKQHIIKEVKRIVKVGGKIIIEEGYGPNKFIGFAWEKVMEDLKKDKDFDVRVVDDGQTQGTDRIVIELTKREPSKGQ